MKLLTNLEVGRKEAGQHAIEAPFSINNIIKRFEKRLLSLRFEVSQYIIAPTNPFEKALAGDVLGVLPENDAKDIARLEQCLKADMDSSYFLKGRYEADQGQYYNQQEALRFVALSPVKIETLQLITERIETCSNPEKLAILKESFQQLQTIIQAYHTDPTTTQLAHQHLVDVLEAFPNLVNLQEICDTQGANYRRVYTISSIDRDVQGIPTAIEILVASDVSYCIPKGGFNEGTIYAGAGTGYLKRCLQQSNPTANVFVQPRKFGAPEKQRTYSFWDIQQPSLTFLEKLKMPLLLIAAGSGVSGMRSILEERAYWQQLGYDVGQSKLIFGIQRKDVDFLYKDDWVRFLHTGLLSSIHLAESRPIQGKKKYVQHLLMEGGFEKEITAIAAKKQGLVICGDRRMGQSLLHAYLPFLLALEKWVNNPQYCLHNTPHIEKQDIQFFFEMGRQQVANLRKERIICASASGSRYGQRKITKEEEFQFFLSEISENILTKSIKQLAELSVVHSKAS